MNDSISIQIQTVQKAKPGFEFLLGDNVKMIDQLLENCSIIPPSEFPTFNEQIVIHRDLCRRISRLCYLKWQEHTLETGWALGSVTFTSHNPRDMDPYISDMSTYGTDWIVSEFEETKFYSEVRDTFGTINQVFVAVEEMAELTQALSKYNRLGPDPSPDKLKAVLDHIQEEIGDVQLMLDQLVNMFGFSKGVYLSKLTRLYHRMKDVDTGV